MFLPMKQVEVQCFHLFCCSKAQSVPFQTEMGSAHKLQTSHLENKILYYATKVQ